MTPWNQSEAIQGSLLKLCNLRFRFNILNRSRFLAAPTLAVTPVGESIVWRAILFPIDQA